MPPAIATWTPAGISTGYLPTRDITCSPSEDGPSEHAPSEHPTQHFADNIGGARLGIAHHAARRGQDRDAKPSIHPRQLLDPGIDPPAWLGDARDLLDDRFAGVIFQLDPQLRHTRAKLLGGETADEALAL